MLNRIKDLELLDHNFQVFFGKIIGGWKWFLATASNPYFLLEYS